MFDHVGLGHLAVFLVCLPVIVLTAAAVVSTVRTPTLSGVQKAAWAAVLLLLPLGGLIAWTPFWLARRHGEKRQDS